MGMDVETMKLNAPVIGIVEGKAHLDVVREAYKLERENMKQPTAAKGHIAANGALTLTQRKTDGVILADKGARFRSLEKNVAPSEKPVLGWVSPKAAKC